MGSSVRPIALAIVVALASGLAAASGGRAERAADPGAIWLSAEGEVGDGGALAIYRPTAEGEPAATTPSRFRVVIDGRRGGSPRIRATLRSRAPGSPVARDVLRDVPLEPLGGGRLGTPWLVAVADREDRDAPSLRGRAILARLGDRIELGVRRGAGREARTSRPVGARGDGRDLLDVVAVDVRATVLRVAVGGPPAVGGDDSGAREVVADQLEIVAAILSQCHVALRGPSPADIRIADPPRPSMIRVGGRYGFQAAGGAEARISIDGRALDPLRVGAGNTPEETARLIAGAIRSAGHRAELFVNPRAESAAAPTADVVVRRGDGTPAEVAIEGGDPRQPIEVAGVDLSDGLDAYGSEEIGVGTAEERALVRGLADPRRDAVEVFVIDRFADPSKQGESFLAGSAVGPAVIVDWRGVARGRQSYALAHEIAHVLSGRLGHPDDAGDARTFLLMHSRSASARFGPKRLTAQQCAEIRANPAGFLATVD